MRAKVKSNGLLIPKKMLKGIKEAEIIHKKGEIIIFPTVVSDDPVMSLGQNPGHSGLGDISNNHDKYLY